MTKQEFQNLLIFSLILLIPIPGRVGYTLIILLELFLLILLSFGFNKLLQVTKIFNYKDFLLPFFLITMSSIYKLLLGLYSAEMSLTLGLAIYLPAFLLYIFSFYNNYQPDMEQSLGLKKSVLFISKFSLYAFIISLIRDVFGYGTITLPAYSKLMEIVILKDFKYSFMGIFWASVPGCLSLILFSYILFSKIIWRDTNA